MVVVVVVVVVVVDVLVLVVVVVSGEVGSGIDSGPSPGLQETAMTAAAARPATHLVLAPAALRSDLCTTGNSARSEGDWFSEIPESC